MSPPSQQSAFLQCLACLDVDTWAQVPLPMLIKQGSARDVALTCSQLRDLCHGAVQHINLSTLHPCDNISAVEDMVQGVPQHFSNCTSVQLLLCGETSYHTTPYLLPALAKLPRLNLIKLRVEGTLQPLLMGTVLYSLRAQLAQSVRSLSLDLQQDWIGAGHAWIELARLTALTKLSISFGELVVPPLVEQDLLPLSNLRSLQDLTISTPKDFAQPLLSADAAGGMTSLTRLKLFGCFVSCIRHVGSCRLLRKLVVSCPDIAEEEQDGQEWAEVGQLGAPEWAAVGQLIGLEQLHIFNGEVWPPTAEFRAAVSKLVRLESIGAGLWSGDVVGALTACTGLTEVVGGWLQGSGAEEGITLPSVTKLQGIGGVPPFSAFPNLTSVWQSAALTAAAFADMARHCTGLQSIRIVRRPTTDTTFYDDEPASVRVAAVKELSCLEKLSQLDFMVQDGVEVLALADTLGALLPRLAFLRVFMWSDVPLPCSAVMTLGKLQGLRWLNVQLTGVTATCDA